MIDLDTLAPGVLGYTCQVKDELWIPLIRAENPGTGQVAAYLDRLPRDRTICLPNVLSPKLAGMLERRGFRVVWWWAPEVEEWIECYVRREHQPVAAEPASPPPPAP